MPRKSPPRRSVTVRLSAAEEMPVIEVAEAEFDGCLSEAVRVLLAEALAARRESCIRR